MFSRRGFIAGILASVAHLVVSRTQKPETDLFKRPPMPAGTVKEIGGSFEMDESVWYVGAPQAGASPVLDPYTGEISYVCEGVRYSSLAHTLFNAKIKYVQHIKSLDGSNLFVVDSPTTIVGQVDRFAVAHFKDGDQMCDMLGLHRPKVAVAVYPTAKDKLKDCDVHAIIRLTNVKFGEAIMKQDGTQAVLFTADAVNYSTESKHVGTPELRGKDASPRGGTAA